MSAGKHGATRKPADRLRQILSIARRRFAEQGFDGASLGQIATDTGIRKASLYYYFSTKEALYAAVLDEIVFNLRDRIRAAMEGQDGYVSALDSLGTHIVDYLGRNRESANLLVREMIGPGYYRRGAGREAIEGTLDETAGFLRKGMDAGAFRRQDERHLALTIIGLHLYYFAAPDASRHLIGGSIFTRVRIGERREALTRHVRLLCLAPDETLTPC